MENLPFDMKVLIASNLSYRDIVSLCKVIKICNQTRFWQALIMNKYPLFVTDEEYSSSPHKLFKSLEESYIVTVKIPGYDDFIVSFTNEENVSGAYVAFDFIRRLLSNKETYGEYIITCRTPDGKIISEREIENYYTYNSYDNGDFSDFFVFEDILPGEDRLIKSRPVYNIDPDFPNSFLDGSFAVFNYYGIDPKIYSQPVPF